MGRNSPLINNELPSPIPNPIPNSMNKANPMNNTKPSPTSPECLDPNRVPSPSSTLDLRNINIAAEALYQPWQTIYPTCRKHISRRHSFIQKRDYLPQRCLDRFSQTSVKRD